MWNGTGRTDSLFGKVGFLSICVLVCHIPLFAPQLSAAADRGISVMAREHRLALVIGNGTYRESPLANPVNDARDMAAALARCGFTTITQINASRLHMRSAIREFDKKLRKGGVGLFFFAGHGIQINGENYLVPIGADVNREYEIEDECVKVSNVLRAMEYAGNRLNIVILDACRNNPFKRSFRSTTRGLANMEAPAGTLLAYATAPGSVAADGTGRNGLYTSTILEYMMADGLPIERLFKRVRRGVMKATEGNQVPWESSSLTGDFYFRLPKEGTRPAVLDNSVPEWKKQDSVIASVAPSVREGRFFLDPAATRESKSSIFVFVKNRFSRKADGTIYDSLLKKTWLVAGTRDIFDWHKANDYCESRDGNYRLPTKEELQSLITKERLDGDWGEIDSNFFPKNSRSNKCWTSSSGAFGVRWYIDFSKGTWKSMSRTNYCAVFAIAD